MTNQRPRTIEEQIVILKQRGMEFTSELDARALLARVSYFRLKYYWIDMIDDGTDDFKEGSCFDDVIERYEFDKELRQINPSQY